MLPKSIICIIVSYAFEYKGFVDWFCLSSNPNAIYILEKNLDKVDWFNLSFNLNAIHILEKNLDKVNWILLSRNTNIF